MRRFVVRAVVGCCVLSLVALAHTHSGFANSQENADAPKAAAKKTTMKPKRSPKKAGTKKKAGGRLPAYYGQIGLTAEQREKIYGIQRTYREQIQELRKQLQTLEAKQKEEIDDVLTEEQKTKLADLIAEAKKKRSTTTKKKKSAASEK